MEYFSNLGTVITNNARCTHEIKSKIGWTNCMRKGEVLLKVEERNSNLRAVKGRKADWICHILHRNSSKTRY
jgi:hypothetical protein